MLTIQNLSESLRSRGFVLKEPGWHIWCNAPVWDDEGVLHLFVSRWPVADGFELGWHTTCEIAHYHAEAPEGPYTYVSTILQGDAVAGSWRRNAPHNPAVVRLPDGQYALFFIANSAGLREEGFPSTQRIGLMTAPHPDGPWTLQGQDGLILDLPVNDSIWSHDSVVGVNNPTLLPRLDGRFFLYYKAMKAGAGQVRRMGLAIADRVEGPYTFQPSPLTENADTIEDGFAFELEGQVCLLVTEAHGPRRGGGLIYRSIDGLQFDQHPVKAYDAVDSYLGRWETNEPGYTPWVLERPALLRTPNGDYSHLFCPCGTPPEGSDGTATFVFEISPEQ